MRAFPPIDIAAAEKALEALRRALAKNFSDAHCLRAWSRFIRQRDGNQCVVCNRKRGLTAHHIVRKSFMSEARFQTGNGIALCARCHREPHRALHRRADLDLPMDAEGGENIELLFSHFCTLIDDATNRSLLHREEFYHLTDQLLAKFKRVQSIRWDVQFPGTRLRQAALIWRQTPRGMLSALLQVTAFPPVPHDFVQTETIAIGYKPSGRSCGGP